MDEILIPVFIDINCFGTRDHIVEDIVRSSTNTRRQLDLSIFTLSEELTWEHPKKKAWYGVLGLSAVQHNSYWGRYIIPVYWI